MTIGPRGKRDKRIDTAQHLINHIPPISDGHATGNAHITRITRGSAARVRAPLETLTGRAPGNCDALIIEQVEIGIARRLDHGPRVPLALRDRCPQSIFLARVAQCRARVEQPVALLRDQRLHLDQSATGRVETHLRPDDSWSFARGGDDFRVGGALRRVEERARVVDYLGKSEDRVGGQARSGLEVLGVDEFCWRL